MKYVGTEHFDQYLKIKQGTEQYLDNKRKAGMIGGAISRPSIPQVKLNAEAAHLARFKSPTIIKVRCVEDFERFERGKMYDITISAGAKIISPIEHQFNSWRELLKYFRRVKVK